MGLGASAPSWRGIALVLTGAILLVPIVVASHPDDAYIGYSLHRGVQVESVAASTAWISQKLTGESSQFAYRFKSYEIDGADGFAAIWALAGLAGLAALAFRAGRGGAVDPWLGAFTALVLLLIANKVLSPQFIAWPAPLAAVLGGRWFRAWLVIAALTLAAYVGSGPTWILSFAALRNAGLVLVAAAGLRADLDGQRPSEAVTPGGPDRLARVSQSPAAATCVGRLHQPPLTRGEERQRVSWRGRTCRPAGVPWGVLVKQIEAVLAPVPGKCAVGQCFGEDEEGTGLLGDLDNECFGAVGKGLLAPVAPRNAAEATVSGVRSRERPGADDEPIPHPAAPVDVVLRGVERPLGTVEPESSRTRGHDDPVGMVEAEVGSDQLAENAECQRMVDEIAKHLIPTQKPGPVCTEPLGGNRGAWAKAAPPDDPSEPLDLPGLEGVVDDDVPVQMEPVSLQLGDAHLSKVPAGFSQSEAQSRRIASDRSRRRDASSNTERSIRVSPG